MLYVFEDNEAVIKTITKGRSPTMRHVSRTRTESTWTSRPISNLSIQKTQLADQTPCRREVRKEGLRKRNRARSACLVSRKCFERKTHLLFGFGCFRRPGRIKNRVRNLFQGTQGHLCETIKNRATNSQKLQKDSPRLRSTRTPENLCEVLKTNVQRLDFHNLAISDNQFIDKVFKTFRQEVESHGECRCTQQENQCIDLGIINVDNEESLCASWAKFNL